MMPTSLTIRNCLGSMKASLSVSAVSSILEAEYILSPKVTLAKQKRIKKHLKELKNAAKTQKEADAVQTNLVAVEDAHSRRPRAAYFGELLQMDSTSFEWVPVVVWHLHLAIDDASGRIVSAWLDTQETLNGYYHVFHQILTAYGIPYKFFTDHRTVFTYKKKNSPSLDEDTYTQFYIKEFNEIFSLPLNGIKSVFETQPLNEKINLALAACYKFIKTILFTRVFLYNVKG